jgi:peptidoglycan L-alanyl-D-glutamate endopeptidase CwlK
MPNLSQRSLHNLESCHSDLQKVAHEAIKHFDFAVICGHRGKSAQDKAYAEGRSKLKFPSSKHNKTPALAFDAVPHPLDWDDIESFHTMAVAMKTAAKAVGVKIRWGGDFKGFFDGPHFELA